MLHRYELADMDDLFSLLLKLRLLQPLLVLGPGQGVRCVCGEVHHDVDILDAMVHCSGCVAMNALRIERHTALRDRLARLLVGLRSPTAHVGKESQLILAGGQGHLQSDVSWLRLGEVYHFDIVVSSPCSRYALEQGSDRDAGVASSLAEREKVVHYSNALEANNLGVRREALKPVGYETTGRQGLGCAGVGALVMRLEGDIPEDVDRGKLVRRYYLDSSKIIWAYNARFLKGLAGRVSEGQVVVQLADGGSVV